MLNLKGPRTVLLASPNMGDGSGWWRMIPPWNSLRENVPHLGFQSLDMALTPPTWPPIALSHVVVVNRPFLGQHLSIVDTAAASGIPAIVDYDDCLWDIPRWNRAFYNYGEQERSTAHIAATRAAVVTTTTKDLADYIQLRIAPDADIRVIPNAFPDWYTWPTTKRQKVLLYRGGDSHMADLAPHHDAIVRVLELYPDWKFVSVGTEPFELHERLKNSEHVNRSHIPVFHRWLRTSGVAAMIVPLRDCNLNRCKSNIAWMEGSLAGAAVMAPAWSDEFDRPGVFRYEHFEDGLLQFMEANHAAMVSESQTYIDDCLRHRHVSLQRAQILDELLN